MYKKYLLLLFIALNSTYVKSQEVNLSTSETYMAVQEVIELFRENHGIQFSYDVAQMQQRFIPLQGNALSLESFKDRLRNIGIILEKNTKDTYLVVQSQQSKAYCILVKDNLTGSPVPNVTIFNDTQFLGTTDFTGEAVLEEAQLGSLLTYSYTGYETLYKVVTLSTDCHTIVLQDDVQNLDEVVLKSYLTRGLVKNKNSSLTLNTKKLAILPGLVEPDVFQSLQLIPGINSPQEDPASLHIRGGTPDQNLLLWDGIKIYQNSHFFNQITSFNPYITKKVEVFRGGTSVRYGDRISGVINMESDDDVFDDIKGGGGVNLLSADAYLKIPISKKLGVMIAGRRSLTDIYQSFTYNALSSKVFENERLKSIQDIENETPLQYYFADWNAKLIYKPNDHHQYTLSVIDITNNLDNNNTGINNNENFEVNELLKQRNNGASFTWLRKKENSTTKRFQLFLSNYSSIYTFDFIPENEGSSNISSFRRNQVTEFGYDLSYDIPFGKHHAVLLGNQLQTTAALDGNFDIFSFNDQEFIDTAFATQEGRVNLTGYLEHRYDAENILLSSGVRAEFNNLVGLLFEPRIFTSIKVTDALRITASLERKNQSFSQINNPQVEPNFYNILPAANQFWSIQFDGIDGGLNFLTQKSNQFTVGGLFNKNGWAAELEGYFKNIDDTTPLTDSFITSLYRIEQRSIITSGKASRYGIDFLLKKQIKNYRAWLSYTWAKNTAQYMDIQSLSFPEAFDQRHRFNLSQTYAYNRFEFALGWTYGSGLPFTPINTGTPEEIASLRSNNAIYSGRLPAYHRLDISSIYHFKTNGLWNGKAGFSVRNIYNRQQGLQENYSIGLSDTSEFFLKSTTNESLRLTADFVVRVSF